MNIYELAQKTVTEKTQWMNAERVVLWENSTDKVIAECSKDGDIFVYVLHAGNRRGKVSKVKWFAGYRGGMFRGNEYKYSVWQREVKKELGKC
jgi:hypothetical protein